MKKSIYNIILENTNNSIVNNSKVLQILHNENINFQMNIFNNEAIIEEHSEKVFTLIEGFYKKEISKNELESALVAINFKAIEIIAIIFKKFNDSNYDARVYEVFKDFLFTTNNLELFKLSLDMTAVNTTCLELSNEYLLIGQVDCFSNAISFIFRTWIEFDEFKENMFKLLYFSSDWTTIDYAKNFMAIEGLLDSTKAQRNLLIGVIANNSLLMEIAVELTETLNIQELINVSAEDRELSLAINKLFISLLLELDRYGGIFAFYDTSMYLDMYFNFLTNSEFEDIQFVGFNTLYEFILDLKENYYDHVEGNYDKIIETVTKAVEKYNTPENFDKALTYGEDNLYNLIKYAKTHQISDSAISYFIDLDIKHELDEYLLIFLESLLAIKGTKEIKTQMFKELCDICNQRRIDKPEMSEVNVFDDFEGQIILSRKILINEFWNEGGFELLKLLIRDYNPTIRVQTLEFIQTLNKEDLDAELIQRIKNRLIDNPQYIVEEAIKVCEKFDLL
ncbi:MAG: hypothetical protein ACRCWM_11880 [Sarcina sp.]